MIVSIQGYNGKKNKATTLCASLSGMIAMKKNMKSLIIQLIDSDIESVEAISIGINKEENYFDEGSVLSEGGVDAALNVVESSKLTKNDFDSLITPMLRAENLMDVLAITKNKTFSSTLSRKTEALAQIIENAKGVYDMIYLLYPVNIDKSIIEELNSLVDVSIYCLSQGHLQKGNAYGKKIIYVITDFESDSSFSVKGAKKIFCKGTDRIVKIERNMTALDTARSGKLLSHIRKNMDVLPDDTNYQWSKDLQLLSDKIMGNADEKKEINWETIPVKEVVKKRSFLRK